MTSTFKSSLACCLLCFGLVSLVSASGQSTIRCSNFKTGEPLPAGTVCRPFRLCDSNVNYCNGFDSICPLPVSALADTECAPARGACEIPGLCDGTIDGCRPAQLKPNGTYCREPTDVCEERSQCDGVNPTCLPVPKPSSFRCRVPRGPCEEDGFCSGSLQISGCRDSYSPTTKVCASAICARNSTCPGNHFSCPPLQALPNMTVCRTLDPSVPSCVIPQSFCNGFDINVCPEVLKPNNTICGYAQWNSCPRPQSRVCSGLSGDCPGPTSCVCLDGEYGLDCSCSAPPSVDSRISTSCVNNTWTLTGDLSNTNTSALNFTYRIIVDGAFEQDRTSSLVVSEMAFITVRQQLSVTGSLVIRIKEPQNMPVGFIWWISGANPSLSGFSDVSVEPAEPSCVYFRASQGVSYENITIYIVKHMNTSCLQQNQPGVPEAPEPPGEGRLSLIEANGSNGGLAAGIIVGSIVFIAFIVGAIVLVRHRRAHKAQNPAAVDVSRIPPVKPLTEQPSKKLSQKIFHERYTDGVGGDGNDDEEEGAGGFSPSFYSDRRLTESFKPRDTRLLSTSESPDEFAAPSIKQKKRGE